MEGAGGKLLSRLSAFWLKALNALIEESLIGKMVREIDLILPILATIRAFLA